MDLTTQVPCISTQAGGCSSINEHICVRTRDIIGFNISVWYIYVLSVIDDNIDTCLICYVYFILPYGAGIWLWDL